MDAIGDLYGTALVIFVVFLMVCAAWLIIGLLTGKIKSEPFHIRITSDKKVTTNKLSELEKCANCGRDIGKLEKTHTFKENPVCAECYSILKNQE
ncbi:MAG: hypothetical protein ABR969_06640 [Sedimentisphaerales bacterium]